MHMLNWGTSCQRPGQETAVTFTGEDEVGKVRTEKGRQEGSCDRVKFRTEALTCTLIGDWVG